MIFIIGGAYQGKTCYAGENFGTEYTIIDDYHLRVMEQLKQGLDPVAEVDKILDADNLVVISRELGYGLVPVDGFEREYREKSGRVNCRLAQAASRVIRVVCGVGTRIK